MDRDNKCFKKEMSMLTITVIIVLWSNAHVIIYLPEAKADTYTSTKIVTEGNFSSESALSQRKILADAGTSDGTPASDSTPAGSETTPEVTSSATETVTREITPSYKASILEMIMDYESANPTPIPIEDVRNIHDSWIEQALTPYKQWFIELGATDENRINFGAGVFYAYRHSVLFGDIGSQLLFQDFISSREIIEYVLGGESNNVYVDENGKPLILMVNMTDDMKKAFSDSIELLKQRGFTNVSDFIRDCGVYVFFTAETQPDEGFSSCLLDEYGVISPNMSEKNTKRHMKRIPQVFAEDILVESLGVAYIQMVDSLGLNTIMNRPDIIGNIEIIKDDIAADLSQILYLKSKDKNFKVFSNDILEQSKVYEKRYNLSIDSAWTKRQIDLIYGVFDSILR